MLFRSGLMSELFAGCSLGQVNFDDGRFYSANSVMQSDRCMCVCTRIDDHCTGVDVCVMQPVDQLSFVIGLKEGGRIPRFAGMGLAGLTDLVQRQAAIDLRLSRPQHIQVGAVDDVDRFRHGLAIQRREVLRRVGTMTQAK